MFEFLQTQNNTENPTEITILITVLSSFFLASLIVLTYELTTKNIDRPVHFLQSMALISIVAATVMQAIGDSVARGLGMLGALAIIRFRTRLDDPRNITFMFAAIAAGIACGVLGFSIAFIGTIGFCVAAILLRFSPLSDTSNLVGNLRLRYLQDGEAEKEVDRLLKKFCQHYELQEVRFSSVKVKKEPPLIVEEEARHQAQESSITEAEPTPRVPVEREQIVEASYLIRIKRKKSFTTLTEELKMLPDIRNVRIRLERFNKRL